MDLHEPTRKLRDAPPRSRAQTTARPVRARTLPDRVSALQSTAGNHAVQGMLAREIRFFKGNQDQRIEVMLPTGSSMHLEIESRDTVEDLRSFLAKHIGIDADRLKVFEWIGRDDPVEDLDWLVPHLIYSVRLKPQPKAPAAVTHAPPPITSASTASVPRVGDVPPVTGAPGPTAFDPESRSKLAAAVRVTEAAAGLGYDILLGGGGAAAVLGSGRAIKDLDFKMGPGLRSAYRQDFDATGSALCEALEKHGLTVQSDASSQYVFKVVVQAAKSPPMEVSITTTGAYDLGAARSYAEGSGRFVVIGELELLLDKLFAFAERSPTDIDKISTDFIDIVTLLERVPQLHDARFLAERLAGYRKKVSRDQGNRPKPAPAKKTDDEPAFLAGDLDTYNGYMRLAPSIALQVTMRSSVVLHDSGLLSHYGARQLRVWLTRIGVIARTLQQHARSV